MLGPEPILAAQSVVLKLREQELRLSTNGLAPCSTGRGAIRHFVVRRTRRCVHYMGDAAGLVVLGTNTGIHTPSILRPFIPHTPQRSLYSRSMNEEGLTTGEYID